MTTFSAFLKAFPIVGLSGLLTFLPLFPVYADDREAPLKQQRPAARPAPVDVFDTMPIQSDPGVIDEISPLSAPTLPPTTPSIVPSIFPDNQGSPSLNFGPSPDSGVFEISIPDPF